MSVSGKTGLQLHLKRGEKLLIGTQRPEEIGVILARPEKIRFSDLASGGYRFHFTFF